MNRYEKTSRDAEDLNCSSCPIGKAVKTTQYFIIQTLKGFRNKIRRRFWLRFWLFSLGSIVAAHVGIDTPGASSVVDFAIGLRDALQETPGDR